MKVFLLTDIPVWVRPLEKALQAQGAEVVVGLSVPENFRPDRFVNRVSTAILRRKSACVPELAALLRSAEAAGRHVINGAKCFEVGLSKLGQRDLFLASAAKTPETASLSLGKRAFPDRSVLLKPGGGGFGRGIRRLVPNEPIPEDLKLSDDWVEQVALTPSDGRVHRLEFLGTEILYHASSPWQVGEYDYCLANVGEAAQLAAGRTLPDTVAGPARSIAQRGGLQLGAMEYFLMSDGRPVFIDFNPVSSLHPNAFELFGRDPLDLVAEYILS